MSLSDLTPLPYRWLAIGGLMLAAGGACYVAGLRDEQAEWQAADAVRTKQDGEYQLAATKAARSKEQALRTKIDTATEQRTKDAIQHAKDLDSVRADARAGRSGLRCPSAALPANPAPADPATAGRPGAEDGRDRIVPGTADDLLRIGGSIVEIVRQRNAIIDTYNAARTACNGDQ
jgi:hypothetical protein